MRITIGICAIVLLLARSGDSIAQSNYFVPSTNYYELNQLRYSLMAGETDEYPNLGSAGDAYDGTGTASITAADDDVRGKVAGFPGGSTPAYVEHSYPPNVPSAASLSIWVKPTANPGRDFILAKGDQTEGFSLYMDVDNTVAYAAWCTPSSSSACSTQASAAQEFLVVDGQVPLIEGEWNNIVVTHEWSSSGEENGSNYVALYVNGVLAQNRTVDVNGGGILTSALNAPTGYIGSASTSGLVQGPTGAPASYTRDLNDTAEIANMVTPFYGGLAAEFRYFPNKILVCSNRAVSAAAYQSGSYYQANRDLAFGAYCVLQSDINSIATDRIEQRAYLARLPYRANLMDVNYANTGTPNAVDESRTQAPAFVAAQSRISAAQFGDLDSASQTYPVATYTGGSLNSSQKNTFSVSLWFAHLGDTEDTVETLYKAGDAANGGVNIYLENGYIFAGQWDANGVKQFVRSMQPIQYQAWRHLAVVFDASSNGPIENGILMYLDGELVGSTSGIPVAGYAAGSTNIGAKGDDDPGYSDLTPSSAITESTPFDGLLSEIQVFAAPLTAPQVRQRATRYPRAYDPIAPSESYNKVDTEPAVVNGYVYVDSKASGVSPIQTAGYDDYNALHIQWTYDWSEPASEWVDPVTGQATEDCAFMLTNVSNGSPESLGPILNVSESWGVDQPRSVGLCFTPQKIGYNISPFTLAFWYPDRNAVIYYPVYESLMLPDVLTALQDYSAAAGVSEINTNFQLTIGRYNTVVQAKTTASSYYYRSPNYVSLLLIGADQLVTEVFDVDATDFTTFIHPDGPVSYYDRRYLNQKLLLDELDSKYSKDR